MADAIEALPAGEREALLLFAWEETLVPGHGRGARATDRHGALAAQPRPRALTRTVGADGETSSEVAMKPVDLLVGREAGGLPCGPDRPGMTP